MLWPVFSSAVKNAATFLCGFVGAVSVICQTASTNCSAVIRLAIGPAKTKSGAARLCVERDRLRLIGVRVDDQPNRALQIVAVVGQIDGQVVEQVGAPRLGLHRVDRMHDAAAHQPVPEAVDDRPREPAVLAGRSSARPVASAARRCGACGSIWPSSGNSQAASAILPVGLSQRCISSGCVGVDGGQAVRVGQLPAVDEAVVARSALQVDAEKHLRHVLGELQLPASGWRSRCRAT